MRSPKPIGRPIDLRRYKSWLADFSTYAHTVTQRGIELWLEQFKGPDRDIAARLLDCIYFAGSDHIQNTYRNLLNGIDGWSKINSARQGRWFFVAFSGSAGESGDRMLHEFRLANGLSAQRFSNMFVHRSELVSLRPSHDDTVIFIDDFAATGNQACTSWKDFFAELVSEGPRIYLMLVAATRVAIARIGTETDMAVSVGSRLDEHDDFFSDRCTHFTSDEKARVLEYCRIASRESPRGWGNVGALVVFGHRCPNSSLPILHKESQRWDPLFRR